MSWRAATRAVIIGVTVLTIVAVLLVGHVLKVPQRGSPSCRTATALASGTPAAGGAHPFSPCQQQTP